MIDGYKPCPGCGARHIPLRDAVCRVCAASGVTAGGPAQGGEVEAQTAYPCPADAYDGPEKELQRVCENRLTGAGVRWPIHLPPKIRALKGLPDILVCFKGRPCAVELKVRGGRVKPEQAEALKTLAADGWRVAVCWSLRDFDEFLNNQTRGME